MSTDFDELELRLMREFLDQASPLEWLVTALSMNYDGKAELIMWMSEHPRLDRATAAALYWYSQPSYYQRFAAEHDVPPVNRRGWRIVHALQDRVLSGTTLAAGAAWDPANDLASPTGRPEHPGHDWTSEAAPDGLWPIPAELYEPVPGPDVDVRRYIADNGWEEGMPPSALAVLEAAYEADED